MEHYDVIIIGAGSTGSVLASRLSENADRSVLLIEAGPDYQTADSLPFELVNSHRNALKDHDWGLNYAPTETQSVALPRGRVVGGSSAVNTTIALRGIPEDYDSWGEAEVSPTLSHTSTLKIAQGAQLDNLNLKSFENCRKNRKIYFE